MVFVGSALLAFSVRNFAEFNIVLIFLWPVVAWAIYREHKLLLPREDAEPVEQVG